MWQIGFVAVTRNDEVSKMLSEHQMNEMLTGLIRETSKGHFEVMKDQVNWFLGNMKLCIATQKVDYYVSVEYKKNLNQKIWWPLTHLHIFPDELEEFIRSIDDPDHVIEVKRQIFLGETFSIVDKSTMMPKKRAYYSI